jgi:hypothetical protein
MPMVSLKLMAGAARSMVVASARTTAAEIAARWCARKVWGACAVARAISRHA